MEGDYTHAEALFDRALKINEATFGAESADVGASLNLLVECRLEAGNHTDDALARRALAICESKGGPHSVDTAAALSNTAKALQSRGEFDAAEEFLRRALKIQEAAMGAEHPDTGQAVLALAQLYQDKGALDDAELLYCRALGIYEASFSPGHRTIIYVRGCAGVPMLLRGADNGQGRAAVEGARVALLAPPHNLPRSHLWIRRLSEWV